MHSCAGRPYCWYGGRVSQSREMTPLALSRVRTVPNVRPGFAMPGYHVVDVTSPAAFFM